MLGPRKKTSSQRRSSSPRSKSWIAATPAEGLCGLVVKLGLHQFLNDHADAASLQVESAYADLVRLTGHDPATEICDRFEREAA